MHMAGIQLTNEGMISLALIKVSITYINGQPCTHKQDERTQQELGKPISKYLYDLVCFESYVYLNEMK